MNDFVRNTDDCDLLQVDLQNFRLQKDGLERDLGRAKKDFFVKKAELDQQTNDLYDKAVRLGLIVTFSILPIGRVLKIAKRVVQKKKDPDFIASALIDFSKSLEKYYEHVEATKEALRVQNEILEQIDRVRILYDETYKMYQSCLTRKQP